MKVKELVAQLNGYDPEMEVHFAHLSPGREMWLSPSVEGLYISRVSWSFLHDTPKLAETLVELSTAKDALILMP